MRMLDYRSIATIATGHRCCHALDAFLFSDTSPHFFCSRDTHSLSRVFLVRRAHVYAPDDNNIVRD